MPEPRSGRSLEAAPGHFPEFVKHLLATGFVETDHVYQPEAFGSECWTFERSPVRIRIIWNGKDQWWEAQLSATEWPRLPVGDGSSESWVYLFPVVRP